MVHTTTDQAPDAAPDVQLPDLALLWSLIRSSVDVAAWATATIGAFFLRFDGSIPVEQWSTVWFAVGLLTILKLIAVLAFSLQRQNWAAFSFRDVRRISAAMSSATIAGTALALAVQPWVAIPLTVPLMDGMLTVLLMLGARMVARQANERQRMYGGAQPKRKNVLLIGAGEAGSILVREMLRHPETGLRPVGFVDDDRSKVGRTIATVPVLGTINDLSGVLEREGIDEVLICIPSADGRAIRSIVERVREANPAVTYRTMPALHELLSGHVTINRIRDVGIDDLLRRPPVQLDTEGIFGYLQGQRVMVTGAGGSIGSELIRQICRFRPKELILFGHGENSIYQLERELDRTWPGVRYSSVIAAVQNVVRLDDIFQRYRPHVVFHTAAHKHVPLMELNPEEAVFNNIIGTRNLVSLALKHGVSHFVNVSTDKAVNPTSVMGASKRVGELIVEQASRRAAEGQAFVSVRFGNVLGSRGSAVPIFMQQIRSGGPVTVTHKDMVRYFMTIPEAARLVLQASAQGKNGEIYILDMGEPVRVLDLVNDLIRLSGLEPEVDIPIEFTGVRPGEKLFEELTFGNEERGSTEHEKIFVTHPQPVDAEILARLMRDLTNAALASDGDRIRSLLEQGIEGSQLTGTASREYGPGAPRIAAAPSQAEAVVG